MSLLKYVLELGRILRPPAPSLTMVFLGDPSAKPATRCVVTWGRDTVRDGGDKAGTVPCSRTRCV